MIKLTLGLNKKHHESSPLRKEFQPAWDDLICRDSLNTYLNIKSPWNYCWLLLHKIATLLPGQKRSQLSILEIWSDLVSSVLQFAFQTNSLESTKWHCCKIIDELGLHGLSCTKNVCRFPRYSAINSIFSKHHWLALILEPVGLTGDRPDGLTSGPCYRGRITLNGGPAGQLVLSQRPKPRLGCNSFWHFYLGPLQRQCYC